MKKGSKRVIPGFGLSLGVTLSVLSIVVLIPLASLVVYTAKLSPAEFWETITRLTRKLASTRGLVIVSQNSAGLSFAV